MTVSTTARLAFLPFRSPGGPFPDGIWTSQQTLIMDASGGDAIITHEVLLLTEPFSALMLTLEQITIDDAVNVATNYIFEAIGFEEHNPVGNNNVLVIFQTLDAPGSVADALSPERMMRKPIFLGRADRTSGQNTAMSLRGPNVDGGSLRDALWGYYWGPGAMNEPGGPQRPPGSLFGN